MADRAKGDRARRRLAWATGGVAETRRSMVRVQHLRLWGGGAASGDNGFSTVGRRTAADHDPVRAGQRVCWFTQRSGGEKTVPVERPRAIHENDIEISRQESMLETVIEQDQTCTEFDCPARAGAAVRTHDDDRPGHGSGQHPRFVPGHGRRARRTVACGDHQRAGAGAASVAAAHDRRGYGAGDHPLRKPAHQRGLSRSSDGEVADADHRRVNAAGESRTVVT